MNNLEFFESCKFGVVALSNNDGKVFCHHLCLYPEPISQEEVNRLAFKLNTDPEFNLVGRIGNGIDLITLDGEALQFFKDQSIKSKSFTREDVEGYRGES